jgi:carbon storage regulator
MPRWVWLLANGSADVAIVLLLLDPTRDLRPVFALLAQNPRPESAPFVPSLIDPATTRMPVAWHRRATRSPGRRTGSNHWRTWPESASRRSNMLVLSRKPGEQLVIGNDITLTVVWVRGNRVRLAFEAPDQVRILRSELACRQVEPAGGDGLAEPAFEGGGDKVRPPQG